MKVWYSYPRAAGGLVRSDGEGACSCQGSFIVLKETATCHQNMKKAKLTFFFLVVCLILKLIHSLATQSVSFSVSGSPVSSAVHPFPLFPSSPAASGRPGGRTSPPCRNAPCCCPCSRARRCTRRDPTGLNLYVIQSISLLANRCHFLTLPVLFFVVVLLVPAGRDVNLRDVFRCCRATRRRVRRWSALPLLHQVHRVGPVAATTAGVVLLPVAAAEVQVPLGGDVPAEVGDEAQLGGEVVQPEAVVHRQRRLQPDVPHHLADLPLQRRHERRSPGPEPAGVTGERAISRPQRQVPARDEVGFFSAKFLACFPHCFFPTWI